MSNENAASCEAAEVVKVADMVDACDVLLDLADRYLEQIQGERAKAEESQDYRYVRRLSRASDEIGELAVMLDDAMELLGLLRHNHQQLIWARQGKLV